jgi:carbonic anhydrase
MGFMEPKKTSLSETLKADLPASLVVFLVAMPLSLGIALASGAPVMSGLIAGIIGGIVAGSLAGAPLQVTGPAAGLTVITLGMVNKFGWPVTCAITVGAGILQIILALARVAGVALKIPQAVVHGMLAGIGVTIAAKQAYVMLEQKSHSHAWENLLHLPAAFSGLNVYGLILGLVVIAILYGWRVLPKKVQLFPGSLVAVIVGTILAIVTNWNVKRVEIPDSFQYLGPQIPTNGDWIGFAIAIATVAIVASVESLLCAVATDKLHSGPRANLNKELLAQGVTNTVSGLAGGLPVTGVIVRSSANINAGGKSRASAILHGVWILVFVLFLSSVIKQIPLAVLAGLLIFVGINLVNPKHIAEAKEHKEVPAYFITLFGIIGSDLLIGVALGIAYCVGFSLWKKFSGKSANKETDR